VGTKEGEECFRDNEAGGQESYQPRVYHTDRLVKSEGKFYWVRRNSRGYLHCEETTEEKATPFVGQWFNHSPEYFI
jgi:hypothetical protein